MIRALLFSFLLAAAALVARAAPSPPAVPTDVLVYKDGDRVKGRLVSHENGVIVFATVRFGEVRVSDRDAEVVLTPTPALAASVAAASAPAAPTSAATAGSSSSAPVASSTDPEAEGEGPWWSLAPVTHTLREFFGHWHGRVGVSTQATQDSNDKGDIGVEVKLNRKWARDEVRTEGRYDLSRTNEITTTEKLRANGSWRHDFGERLFSTYRPSLEWNRAFYRNGLPADYVLLQQEAGIGFKVYDRPDRKLRVGISENMFDLWTEGGQEHSSENVESFFAESELKLPWRIVVSDRVVLYYDLSTTQGGWENQFDVTKKLTETLSLGLRHEIRRNNPNVGASDYSMLRTSIGFDF